MIIRKMTMRDIKGAAAVHKTAFLGEENSEKWIECNFRAFPRMQYFVAEDNGTIIGFIHWNQKGGFRSKVILELEQIAVFPERRGEGIGSLLINESFSKVQSNIAERGAIIKHLIVTSHADNDAQRLYRKTLGVEVETTIANLYSGDEVVMIARNVDKRLVQ